MYTQTHVPAIIHYYVEILKCALLLAEITFYYRNGFVALIYLHSQAERKHLVYTHCSH